MKIRVGYIGCVEMSHALLAHLLTLPGVEISGVVTRHASSFHSDFRSLADLAERAEAPVHFADGGDEGALVEFLKREGPDVIFCFGWSRILKREVLNIAPLGVLGFHPAALPDNRGRHPLIWALVLGLEETASTFFQMDEGADSGPIVSQEPVHIASDDYAQDLYEKVSRTALGQLTTLMARLANGGLSPQSQKRIDGNIWRKRGAADGHIDWRMSARGVYNLVRGLSHPYVGAHCETDAGVVKIWRTEVGPSIPANIEPGKVIDVAGRDTVVKCGDGSVRLTDHEFALLPPVGSYL